MSQEPEEREQQNDGAKKKQKRSGRDGIYVEQLGPKRYTWLAHRIRHLVACANGRLSSALVEKKPSSWRKKRSRRCKVAFPSTPTR